MKGAAMKLGQVLSFLDVGLVPEEHREAFQAKLGELRDAAPKVRFDDMRKVIETDLGESLSDVFDTFDRDPIAAASIGQVYRARLRDGRAVAVKVQYPGVAQAVRADMQNLGMILRVMKSIAPGLDVRSTAEEIRSRIGEELDYELEAQNQRALRASSAATRSSSSRSVTGALARARLVNDFVQGAAAFEGRQADGPGHARPRRPRSSSPHLLRCMYRHRQFLAGKPAPGQLPPARDGLVAFLDFGLFNDDRRSLLDIELACQRAGHRATPRPAPDLVETGSTSRDEFRPSCSPSSSTRRGGTSSTRRGRLSRDRHAGDDRHVRPALGALRDDAPRAAARGPHLRPARGDAHPRRARSARRERELASHRPRVDVRDPPVTELGAAEAGFYARA
jgi:hypothetical protein